MSFRANRPPQEVGIEMQTVAREEQQLRRDSARSSSFQARGGFSKFLRAQGRRTAGYVKDHDLYGQPVSLNYKGEDTFKTVPGGLISLVIKVVFVLYSILKFKYMVVHQEWEITRQERVLTDADIAEEVRFKGQQNLRVEIHVNRKPKKLKRQDQIIDVFGISHDILRESYPDLIKLNRTTSLVSGHGADLNEAELQEFEEETTQNDLDLLSQFFRVFVMVEKRQQSEISTYNSSVNEDLYDWKEYLNPKWTWNQNTSRMEVDLSDAVIKGLEADDLTVPLVISKYQLRFDINKMRDHSFTACLQDQSCGAKLNVSYQEMAEEALDLMDVAVNDKEYLELNFSEVTDYFKKLETSLDYKDKAVLRDTYFLQVMKARAVDPILDRITRLADDEFINLEKSRRADLLEKEPFTAILEIDEIFAQQVLAGSIKLDEENMDRFQYYQRDIEEAAQIINAYLKQESKFRQELNIKLQKYNIELVVHDQIEAFKKHDDKNFNYPFQNRSSKIASFTVDLDPFSETYEYPSEFLKFRKSFVCLEPNIFKQMLFFTDLAEEGISSFSDLFSDNIDDKEEIDEQLEEFCDSKMFQKIKYESSKSTWKDYKDDYEPGVIDGKILLEVVLGLDAFKTEITRSSSQILDFLGDIGGFYGALDLMVFIFGGYFSAKLFAASIAKTLYIQSRKKKDIAKDESAQKADEGGASNFILEKIFSEDGDEQEGQPARKFLNRQDTKKANEDTLQTRMKKIRNQFSPIEFSSVRVVLDPILSSFFCCFSQEKLVKFPIFKRQKVLGKCEDKLNDELEITNLLTRVRESYEMLQNLQTEQSKELLKFSKDKVIDLQDSNSSSSEEEEELQVETPGDNEAQPTTEVKVLASESSSAWSSEYLQFTLPEQIRKAFDYSIVKSLALDAAERVDLLEKLKVYENDLPSKEAASEKDNFSQSLGSADDLQDQLDEIKMRKFGSPRGMISSSKQVDKSEGPRVLNSGVGKGVEDAKQIDPGTDAKDRQEGVEQAQEFEECSAIPSGDIKKSLANDEQPNDPVEVSQVILNEMREPDHSGHSEVKPGGELELKSSLAPP